MTRRLGGRDRSDKIVCVLDEEIDEMGVWIWDRGRDLEGRDRRLEVGGTPPDTPLPPKVNPARRSRTMSSRPASCWAFCACPSRVTGSNEENVVCGGTAVCELAEAGSKGGPTGETDVELVPLVREVMAALVRSV